MHDACASPWQAALSQVQQVRPIACPNSGFMLQLRAFEQQEAERRGGRVYQTRAARACNRQADEADAMLCCSSASEQSGSKECEESEKR